MTSDENCVGESMIKWAPERMGREHLEITSINNSFKESGWKVEQSIKS